MSASETPVETPETDAVAEALQRRKNVLDGVMAALSGRAKQGFPYRLNATQVRELHGFIQSLLRQNAMLTNLIDEYTKLVEDMEEEASKKKGLFRRNKHGLIVP